MSKFFFVFTQQSETWKYDQVKKGKMKYPNKFSKETFVKYISQKYSGNTVYIINDIITAWWIAINGGWKNGRTYFYVLWSRQMYLGAYLINWGLNLCIFVILCYYIIY